MLLNYKLPVQYVFQKTWWNILLVSVLSVFNYLLSVFLQLPNIPVAIPALLGTAISLVLAFKLSQSYDRWWEARIIWGSIVNDARTWAIQLRNFTRQDQSKDTQDLVLKAINRQIAWSYVLGQSLRNQPKLESVENYLDTVEVQWLIQHKNPAYAILDLHGKDISTLHIDGKINDYQHMQLDQTLVRLCDAMGGVERIKNTVFPITYSIYLHLFIYLFLGVLSFSLAEIEGVWQPVVVVTISLPFLLLEKAAFHLQDPFENRPTDISVTAIARTIEINLKQVSNQKDVPEDYPCVKYYIM